MSDNRVLIDTSVWIDYFRNKDGALADKVDEILTYSEVYVPKVVLAELIQGAKTEKEVNTLEDFTGAFNIIDHNADTWLKAGKLSFTMKRRGHTINLIDCCIAIMANENGCKIFTFDEHFRTIRKYLQFEMIS